MLALQMASPGNQHCASCIGTLSVTIAPFKQISLQCFDTVGWASGRASGLYKIILSDDVLVWLSAWSKVRIVCLWSS